MLRGINRDGSISFEGKKVQRFSGKAQPYGTRRLTLGYD